MKIIFISDTHGLHNELALPKGDMIIHGGDITDYGTKEETVDFLKWYSSLNYSYKIFIAGNHDVYLEENPVDFLELLPPNVIYLRNNSVEIEGIKIWGSPVTPDFMDWAFGKRREEMKEHWKYMPKEIDILLTHTPLKGILDTSSDWQSLGCKDLLAKVKEIKPKYHLFGHIHANYGQEKIKETEFINGSNLDSYKGLINPPIIINWKLQ